MSISRSADQPSLTVICQDYIQKMLAVTNDMKSLLLDAETTGIVALCYGVTDMNAREVYLVERLDHHNEVQGTETFQHLKAIVFIRPTQDNIHHIKQQLSSNKYKEYHFCKIRLLSYIDIYTMLS